MPSCICPVAVPQILFKAGVHPEAPANTLDRAAFDRVWRHSVLLLQRGFKTGSILTVDPEEATKLGGRQLFMVMPVFVSWFRSTPCIRHQPSQWHISGMLLSVFLLVARMPCASDGARRPLEAALHLQPGAVRAVRQQGGDLGDGGAPGVRLSDLPAAVGGHRHLARPHQGARRQHAHQGARPPNAPSPTCSRKSCHLHCMLAEQTPFRRSAMAVVDARMWSCPLAEVPEPLRAGRPDDHGAAADEHGAAAGGAEGAGPQGSRQQGGARGGADGGAGRGDSRGRSRARRRCDMLSCLRDWCLSVTSAAGLATLPSLAAVVNEGLCLYCSYA